MAVRTDRDGHFTVTLPYGRYRVADTEVYVSALQTVHLDVATPQPGGWTDRTRAQIYPEAYSLAGILLSREPFIVTEPLDFIGVADYRRPVISQRGFSWTDTEYRLHGLDATDSYQPGFASILPDVEALDHVAVRSAFTPQVAMYLAQPGKSWHGALESADRLDWFTRDHAEIGGSIARHVDLFASATGEWASADGLRSRLLFGNARGRVRATPRDRFDAFYSGSRVDLSDEGLPAGIEALTGNRMMPSFALPGGFRGEPESDHLDFVQAGWTRVQPTAAMELRYGYSIAHLDTHTAVLGQSRVDLVRGVVSGVPPLANMAVRPRHEFAASWQRNEWKRHRISAGGGWKRSEPRNRFDSPAGGILITAGGAPAFVIRLNTPVDFRALVRSWSGNVADHVRIGRSLSLDIAILADRFRGGPIAWNSVSPRGGFAFEVPHAHGLVLRGSFSRWYEPLAGRYLDFGDPNSLGGSMYSVPQGTLVLHFGGPYSSVSPGPGRPFADEFDAGASLPIAGRATASIHLFRRDEKDRLAAINTGVPAQAFMAIPILDPGPDGIPGTFDDQHLTVFAQSPSTFGQDRYLLTNPPGLRELNTGFVAEIGAEWRGLTAHASFVAEKSYGPTNPGDAYYENDPGVIGALFQDPNTAIHAAGRLFMDRAYVGKLQAVYKLPAAWGGIELASVADYTDGLVFARQLLVTGLPQGPIVVAATVRGSPEGGNRAQYVVNWNLRVGRRFALPVGRVAVWADILNVTNARQRVQESDVSGPSFNLRLPVAVEPGRFLRLGIRYDF